MELQGRAIGGHALAIALHRDLPQHGTAQEGRQYTSERGAAKEMAGSALTSMCRTSALYGEACKHPAHKSQFNSKHPHDIPGAATWRVSW